MRQTRKRYNEEFKLQVIIEALRKKSTTKEVARDYNLHPDLVSRWKREFFNSIVYFEFHSLSTGKSCDKAKAGKKPVHT